MAESARQRRAGLDAAREPRPGNVWGAWALRAALGAVLLLGAGIVIGVVVRQRSGFAVMVWAAALAGVVGSNACIFGVAGLSVAYRDQLPMQRALWGLILGLAVATLVGSVLFGSVFYGV